MTVGIRRTEHPCGYLLARSWITAWLMRPVAGEPPPPPARLRRRSQNPLTSPSMAPLIEMPCVEPVLGATKRFGAVLHKMLVQGAVQVSVGAALPLRAQP